MCGEAKLCTEYMTTVGEMWSQYCWESVSSLLAICVDAASTCLELHIATVKVLPSHLKNKLLLVATKRGNVDNSVLKCLLHSDVSHLDLSECSVSDETLYVISVCQNLRKLDLSPGRNQSRDISTQALLAIFPSYPHLSTLYLRRCPAVTDEVVTLLVSCCPLIRELDFGGCTAITDRALHMLKDLKHLVSLNVSSSQVSDQGIVSLVGGACSQTLTELHLGMCQGITDFAIETIVVFCTNMQVLIFHGCPVTDASWVALQTLLTKSKVKQLTWTIY